MDFRGGRYSILSTGDWSVWLMERAWNFNKRNESCVPRDEYELQPHNTPKYPDTYALIGTGVSHGPQQGVPRFACVLHAATFPTDLEGCLTPCRAIGAVGQAMDARRAMDELRERLDAANDRNESITLMLNQ
jgi:hypothetical protein